MELSGKYLFSFRTLLGDLVNLFPTFALLTPNIFSLPFSTLFLHYINKKTTDGFILLNMDLNIFKIEKLFDALQEQMITILSHFVVDLVKPFLISVSALPF
jgi:hypothetical protein